jgi:hypothetical protein
LSGHSIEFSVLPTLDAGHARFAGIASPERAAKASSQLMRRTFYCGGGIRNLAAGEARYNPMSYHNGSVWPPDIALGLARYDFRSEALRVFDRRFSYGFIEPLGRAKKLRAGSGISRRRVRQSRHAPVILFPGDGRLAARGGSRLCSAIHGTPGLIRLDTILAMEPSTLEGLRRSAK